MDSVHLALGLAGLARRGRLALHIAHVHHHQRGGEADEDARFVAEFAARQGIPFTILHVDPALIADAGGSLEGRLRDARIALLRGLAGALGARAIALGHHRDDAAEGFLLMALRGSGPRGLGSLRSARRLETGLYLIRPQLHISRSMIADTLRQAGESWREDSTNLDPGRRRNALRHDVLPRLAASEPAAAELLARSATLCAAETDALAGLVAHVAEGTVAWQTPASVLLDCHRLRALPGEALAPLLRFLWERLAGEGCLPPHDLSRAMVARIAVTDGDESHFGAHTPVHAYATNRHFLLHHESLGLEEALAGTVGPAMGLCLSGLDREARVVARGEGAPPISWLVRNAAALEQGRIALLSGRDPGDARLAELPAGATLAASPNREMIVAELLEQHQVPRPVRSRIMALLGGEGILWVPGVRRAVHRSVGESGPWIAVSVEG